MMLMFLKKKKSAVKTQKKYRFRAGAELSPTLYQLEKFMQAAGFKRTRWAWRAKFTERNLNFAPDACECLEYKHLLAQLLAKYCPKIVPETYILNDYSWSSVLSDLAQEHYIIEQKFHDEIKNLAWILKPSLLNNGQHIKIFNQLSQIEDHMLHPNRLGGPHVLQRYIHNPDLYEGRKYSLRFFVVITRESGAFLYQHGYINVALTLYEPNNFTDLNMHITNEHLQQSAGVVQIPTAGHPKYALWYPKIQSIVTQVTNAVELEFPQAFFPQKERNFAVFGFDFICDDRNHMWLLEVNHEPCFPIESHHPLQEPLYQGFWDAMIKQFVMPIANHQPIPKQSKVGFVALHS
jgi:hypothetical protein